jgi:hypothetical protein
MGQALALVTGDKKIMQKHCVQKVNHVISLP